MIHLCCVLSRFPPSGCQMTSDTVSHRCLGSERWQCFASGLLRAINLSTSLPIFLFLPVTVAPPLPFTPSASLQTRCVSLSKHSLDRFISGSVAADRPVAAYQKRPFRGVWGLMRTTQTYLHRRSPRRHQQRSEEGGRTRHEWTGGPQVCK